MARLQGFVLANATQQTTSVPTGQNTGGTSLTIQLGGDCISRLNQGTSVYPWLAVAQVDGKMKEGRKEGRKTAYLCMSFQPLGPLALR